MIRLVTILLWAVLTAGAAAADSPWSGEWQLTWGNGGALVNLQQDGSRVGGSFGNGRIEGTAHGNSFDGQLVYNGQTENLTATLSDDHDSFAGNTGSGDWLNGLRIAAADHQAAYIAIDLTNPRTALRSFLVAANLAQTTRSYALSSALDVIDFGNDPGWESREARFTGAQQLFQLIDQATFNMSAIPDDTRQPTLALSLPVLDSKNTINIDMVRGTDGKWRIVMPSPEKLRAELEIGKPQAADGFRLLQSPRDTLRAFLDGMRHWDTGGEAQALGTIDLSHVPDVLRQTEGNFVAQYLVRILERVGHRTMQNVPNSGVNRAPFVLFELPEGRIVIEPIGTGNDTRWKFSSATAASIRNLYRAVEQLPDNHALDPGLIPESPMFALRGKVKSIAPFLLGSLPGPAHIEYWQLLAGILALCAMVLATLLLRRLFLWVLTRPFLERHVGKPRRLALALAAGISFLVGSRLVLVVGLPAVTRQYSTPVFGTLLILILAYALWQVVVFILSLLQDYAERTETTIDNILLTFAAGVAKLAIVAGAVLALSYLWSLPTSGLLAGLGISGIAVAFASKETLSNIFGAGILLGDRPFRKGDRIIAGDVNGWVEAVGLRSTRIRTLYDSLLVVPNGKLADMVVNNLGARRRRNLQTTVIITSGATPQRIEAFTHGIRQRIEHDKMFDGEWAEVHISRMWSDGIDVEISAALNTRSGRQAREATHRLYLDIMRLAEVNGMTLAHATAPSEPHAATEA